MIEIICGIILKKNEIKKYKNNENLKPNFKIYIKNSKIYYVINNIKKILLIKNTEFKKLNKLIKKKYTIIPIKFIIVNNIIKLKIKAKKPNKTKKNLFLY